MLTIYHAVYSITIPIVLVELAYPRRRYEDWIGRRTLKILLILLTGVVVFGFLLFNPASNYWPPIPQYLLAILVIVVFGYVAYRLPKKWGSQGKRALPRLLFMWAIGVVGTFIFFFGMWLVPALIPLWPLGIFFGPALFVLYTWLLKNFEWKDFCEKHRFALVSGALTFFIVFAPLQEFDTTRFDNTVGMGFVGLSFLFGLILLGRHVWSESEKDSYHGLHR